MPFINEKDSEAICSFRKAISIVSFSNNHFSQVMWSHYCSNSSGFVLAYEKKNIAYFINKLVKKLSNFMDAQKIVFGSKKCIYEGYDGLYILSS